MTERKPAELSFRDWIEQQIAAAAERGAFDNLPGAGKPLPRPATDEDAAEAWLRDYVRREGVSTEEFLPVPLKLRKESERLAAAAPVLPAEASVRAAAAELNERIMNWRRIPLGPPIFVPLVDEEALVRAWHDAHPAGEPADPGASRPRSPGRAPRRWWGRRR
jgi:Domain of unknown function (DUF1992)